VATETRLNGVGDTLEVWDGGVTLSRARVGGGSVSCRAADLPALIHALLDAAERLGLDADAILAAAGRRATPVPDAYRRAFAPGAAGRDGGEG
jgi:hypothetical protein